jgi:hypothetical protein
MGATNGNFSIVHREMCPSSQDLCFKMSPIKSAYGTDLTSGRNMSMFFLKK